MLYLPSEVDAPHDLEEVRYHPGFELPPFNFDLFDTTLENEPVAEPTLYSL